MSTGEAQMTNLGNFGSSCGDQYIVLILLNCSTLYLLEQVNENKIYQMCKNLQYKKISQSFFWVLNDESSLLGTEEFIKDVRHNG